MTSPVEPIGTAVGPVATVQMNLDEAVGRSQLQVEQHSQFESLIGRAVSTAIERPSTPSSLESERAALVGDVERSNGDEKFSVMSDVARTGTSAPEKEPNATAAADALEARIKTLYFDLTNYQVAWKIAQRIQQDTSQLMRGS